MSKTREYQKKKKQKKLLKYKALEEERECEKNKWLAFSNKVRQAIIIFFLTLGYNLVGAVLITVFYHKNTFKLSIPYCSLTSKCLVHGFPMFT